MKELFDALRTVLVDREFVADLIAIIVIIISISISIKEA